MKIYIGGVNGSGKSSILEEVGKLRPDFKIVRGSAELMRHLGIEGDYQALRLMDQDRVLAEYGKMVFELLRREEGNTLLLDTHYLNLINGEIIDRTGPWIQEFNLLVLVEANPNAILERVEKDGRDRALFAGNPSEEEKLNCLFEYMSKTSDKVLELSKKYEMPYVLIKNEQAPEEAARVLIEEIERRTNATP